MKDKLITKLLQYISENNPELLFQLEEEGKLSAYLSDKVNTLDFLLEMSESEPDYFIEEACMDILTQDLQPSKFNYICTILEEEFASTFQLLQKAGILKYEIINLISFCRPVFDKLGFNETNENDRQIKYAIIGSVSEYLEQNNLKMDLTTDRQV